VIEQLIDPDTFDSVWLAMWWGVQTVTTVGYGDVVPEDTVGQVIGSFLMLGGLSLLAVVTGAITSTFVTRAQAERREAGDDPVMQRLEDVSAQLEPIKAELVRSRPGAAG
jgi:voltage-gated potassium channel